MSSSSAREVRRLLAVLESPALTALSEGLRATAAMKAYKAEDYFTRIYESHLNPTISASIVRNSLDTWVTCRAELISVAIIFACGCFYAGGYIDSVQTGLALSMAITFTKNAYLLLWALIQVEVEMNSVERLGYYVQNIPREADYDDLALDTCWPRTGAVAFQQVTLHYRTQQRPALEQISFDITTGERVGIVGRTGSGKSSLVSTLSRLVLLTSGRILIDGVDIATVSASRLRASIHVLPQEPLVFEGTVRENLDPHGNHSDQDLWRALELCSLDEYFQGGELRRDEPAQLDGLATRIRPAGDNLSSGQMQLLCVARAMLQQPKILVIDEGKGGDVLIFDMAANSR